MRQPLLISTALFGITYFIVERAGLFSDLPKSCLHILYSRPILVASFVMLCCIFRQVILQRKTLRFYHWAGAVSVLLVVSGLWLGSFTRFSAEVILTEGQDFYSGHGNYVPGSLYRGRYAALPELALKMEEIIPSFSSSGMNIEHLEGRVKLFLKENRGTSELVFTDGMPRMVHGTMLKLKGFGYSPRYELKSKTGDVLDTSFVYMRLFPPGSEGFFRLLSPLTYYLRYYPEGKDSIKEPLLRLRIVRNKDVVLNRDVKISEDVDFENSRISFEEVRMWTKLSVKRDWGEMVMISGLAFGLLYAAMYLTGRRKLNT
jgi:hypothetical protein